MYLPSWETRFILHKNDKTMYSNWCDSSGNRTLFGDQTLHVLHLTMSCKHYESSGSFIGVFLPWSEIAFNEHYSPYAIIAARCQYGEPSGCRDPVVESSRTVSSLPLRLESNQVPSYVPHYQFSGYRRDVPIYPHGRDGKLRFVLT